MMIIDNFLTFPVSCTTLKRETNESFFRETDICVTEMSLSSIRELTVSIEEITSKKWKDCTKSFSKHFEEYKTECEKLVSNIQSLGETAQIVHNYFLLFAHSDDYCEIEAVRIKCLKSFYELKDCISLIESYVSTLSISPSYDTCCEKYNSIVNENKKLLKNLQKKFDDTMIVLANK